MAQQQVILKTEKVNIKPMNRDFPLAPTFFPNKGKRAENLREKSDKLAYRGNVAVDEGRDKKADRLLKRAANLEDRSIRLSERKK